SNSHVSSVIVISPNLLPSSSVMTYVPDGNSLRSMTNLPEASVVAVIDVSPSFAVSLYVLPSSTGLPSFLMVMMVSSHVGPCLSTSSGLSCVSVFSDGSDGFVGSDGSFGSFGSVGSGSSSSSVGSGSSSSTQVLVMSYPSTLDSYPSTATSSIVYL